MAGRSIKLLVGTKADLVYKNSPADRVVRSGDIVVLCEGFGDVGFPCLSIPNVFHEVDDNKFIFIFSPPPTRFFRVSRTPPELNL